MVSGEDSCAIAHPQCDGLVINSDTKMIAW